MQKRVWSNKKMPIIYVPDKFAYIIIFSLYATFNKPQHCVDEWFGLNILNHLFIIIITLKKINKAALSNTY